MVVGFAIAVAVDVDITTVASEFAQRHTHTRYNIFKRQFATNWLGCLAIGASTKPIKFMALDAGEHVCVSYRHNFCDNYAFA